jgi:hypothetical protein
MIFSDDDLKRLKIYLDFATNPLKNQVLREHKIKALLARLETAEAVCQFHWAVRDDSIRTEGRERGDRPLLEAWRKECGK